ncbi:MAG: tetratricopeptide repeat protein [Glaciihabitans sp.]
MSIILGYDPSTLRERVDLTAATRRLEELGEQRSLSAITERAALLRLVGRLDDAWDSSNEALRLARFAGERTQITRARIRRAVVQQYQGRLVDSFRELSDCVDEARTHGWTSVEAYALQHRGRVLFDQHEYEAALEDFRASLALRKKVNSSTEQIEAVTIAIAVTETFVDGGSR